MNSKTKNDEFVKLYENMERLLNEWKEQVQESYQGKISYAETEPKFQEYLEAHKEWRDFTHNTYMKGLFEPPFSAS